MAIRSWMDHREATINDAEYYTESWTVFMSIPWVDGQHQCLRCRENNRDLEHSGK